MALKLTNNASSTLAGSIDAVATSISVSSGAGSKFPSLVAGDWFPLTLVDGAGNYEIVKCTARTGDVMTVTRAQEGTSAAAFASGSRVDLRLTAAALVAFIEAALQAVNNLSDLDDPPTARTNLGLGSAAVEAASAFATAAQGAKADSALQAATAAEIIANTGTKGISVDQAWETVAFANVAASGTCTLDLDTGSNFKVTLNGNTTMAFPSNGKDGQVVNILFVQDATGGRTISWASGWKFADITAPQYSTTAGANAGVVSGVVQGSIVMASGGKF